VHTSSHFSTAPVSRDRGGEVPHWDRDSFSRQSPNEKSRKSTSCRMVLFSEASIVILSRCCSLRKMEGISLTTCRDLSETSTRDVYRGTDNALTGVDHSDLARRTLNEMVLVCHRGRESTYLPRDCFCNGRRCTSYSIALSNFFRTSSCPRCFFLTQDRERRDQSYDRERLRRCKRFYRASDESNYTRPKDEGRRWEGRRLDVSIDLHRTALLFKNTTHYYIILCCFPRRQQPFVQDEIGLLER
jgi:hypothetical protein